MRTTLKKLARDHVAPRLGRSTTLRRLLWSSPDFVDWTRSHGDAVDGATPLTSGVVERVHLQHRVGYDDPPLDVEVDATSDQLDEMFEHVRSSWAQMGDDDPFWSVISREEFRGRRIADPAEFYELGRSNVSELLNTLRRNDVDPRRIGSCLEVGCGVGRVTWLLAAEFERVVACDVSQAHLDLARDFLDEHGIDNVDLVRLDDPRDSGRLPSVDLLYSVIVLQHNPPPVIDHLLRDLLGHLNPGGVAVFQVPTYAQGYSFCVADYVRDTVGTPGGMEMHLLPQHRVFAAVAAARCDVLEVFEDNWTGLLPKSASHTFVVRRRTGSDEV